MSLIELFSSVPAGATWLPLADAVAKATIVLTLGALLSLAMRRASAAARHMVWTLALVGALVLPAVSLLVPRWEVPVVRLAAIESVAADSDRSAAAAPSVRREPRAVAPETPAPALTPESRGAVLLAAIDWRVALLAAWLAGVALILGRVALGFAAVQWISRRVRAAEDPTWAPLAREMARGLAVRGGIRFVRGASGSMPMAWGILRPSVMLPAEADTWPAERQRIVILHELAHVKRRDCLTHLAAQIACACYWFNPLAWIAARHVRTERERACDDLVLAAGTRGPDYADQLLEIARVMRAGRFPGVLAGASLAMAHRSQLEGRLMAILDPTVPRAGVSRFRVVTAAAVFTMLVMPLAAVQPWVHGAAPAAEAAMLPAAIDAGADQMPAPTPAPTPAPSVNPTPKPGPGTYRGLLSEDAGAVATSVTSSVVSSVATSVIEASIEGVLEGVQAVIADTKREEGKALDPRAVAALTAALKDTDKDVREAALNALVQMRSPAIYEPLVAALSDASPDMRERAAFGLGQMRDKRAVGPLTAALKDSHANVREQAVFALGQLRDPASAEPLISALKDSAANVRQQAAFALGQLRSRNAVEALIVALKDSVADVREQVAFALGQIRDPRAVDALADAMKDASADVRQQAAFALGQLAR